MLAAKRPTNRPPRDLIGEFAGQAGNEFETYNLFLAVDQVDDSVRGLWSMSFQATCATHDGPVSGTLVGDQLQLRLRPDEDYEATLDLWLRVSPGDTVLSGRPILVEPGSVPGYGGPALCGSDEFDPVVLHQGEVEGMPIGR